ncbi:MAG: Lrp/AsnC family transcriptional regulator [Candidatus Eiseniibacteriota bacterium]|jgi:Lrp/AsnC family leucine-responsive transcriptional regulator
MRLDPKDLQILAIVQADCRTPQADIGRRVGLSAAAVCERLKKLEQQSVITGYEARLDPTAVRCDITAFIEVSIEHQRHEDAFVARVLERPEILECHHVTGEFSCLLKIKVRDRLELKRVLLEEINALPGVRQTRTLIALDSPKENARLPIRVDPPSRRAAEEPA